jgi:nanoRNase/pAp phosphatase (c-di-AMP/oligoRNAs hydrolase)
MNAGLASETTATPLRGSRSGRFLSTLEPYSSVVLVSHVNPDPDALASMLGIQALLNQRKPAKHVTLTVDGIIARAENQAMVDLLEIPLIPVDRVPIVPDTAVVMVDSQPHTGRRASEAAMPLIVLDHHETGGSLDGVRYRDIRPNVGATSTIVTGYLLEQDVAFSPRLATALLYGIESEISGFPREAGPSDDGALVWLFPRADKDLLAQIKNPRLPQSYFATFQQALGNAFLYGDVIFSWCGVVPQPDIIAEVADFFIRFDEVSWAISVGLFENMMKISVRSARIGGHSGEVLRAAVSGFGTAGGHDKRAGGAIILPDTRSETIENQLTTLRHRLLAELNSDEKHGRRLLLQCPIIPAP